MGFFQRILGKDKPATGGAVRTSKSDPLIKPAGPGASSGPSALPGATPGAAPAAGAGLPPPGSQPPGMPPGAEKKGLLRKFESNVRRAVDGYVDKKAGALLDDATKRAEDFRQETLDLVQSQAMQILDITEQRLDTKLQEIETLLEARLQAELRMRLRALIWTLAFVLLMAIISVAYVWIKRSAGLENAPGNAAASARELRR